MALYSNLARVVLPGAVTHGVTPMGLLPNSGVARGQGVARTPWRQ